MSRNVYYGTYGEYGPYTKQEYGLPDAGEVLEDFRNVQLMSVQEFVDAYNKEVVEYNKNQEKKKRRRRLPTITRNLVYKWEKHNMVPADPERRRLIANMLNIPLALFGIVAAEEIVFRPTVQTAPTAHTAPAVITHATVDLQPYEENIRTFWRFHYTSTAQDEEYAIIKAIQELENYEQQYRGNFQRDIREMLYSYYLLVAKVARDQRYYANAYNHANKAVRVAKSMQAESGNKNEILETERSVAVAQYERGYVKSVWGQYGFQDEEGRFQPNFAYIQEAIDNFEAAARRAAPTLKGPLYKELARVQGFTQKSATDIALALNTLKTAETYVGKVSGSDDFYTQVLQSGGMPTGGLTEGTYLLGSAITFNALKRPGKAKDMLMEQEKLSSGHIPRDWTRQHAWTDIVWAQAAFGTRDYSTATSKAKSALLVCQDIHSVGNIAIVKDLYQQLLATSYKNEQDVKDLGRLLTTPI